MIDCGDNCVFCGESTAFGSGRFVNRIGADHHDEETGEHRDGFACSDCVALDCDRCGEKIDHDEDITACDVMGFDADLFADGSYRICESCLTVTERKQWEAKQ